jgi:hypothetical protein
MVLPASHGVPRAPRYSGYPRGASRFRIRAYHPLRKTFPGPSATSLRPLVGTLQPRKPKPPVWALPRSLAATSGISFDFFSSGYLDVSVPRVRLRVNSDDPVLTGPGFPIRTPSDQSLFSGSPKIFAAYRVLHRLLAPRHPPFALPSLTNLLPKKDNRSKPGKIQKSPKLHYPYSVFKEPAMPGREKKTPTDSRPPLFSG